MSSILLNGIALHYTDSGPALDRPTLVFANSLGTDFRIWDGVASRLGGRFRILRYDKRGHGLSDLGRPPYRIEDHVGDLTVLLDARGVSQSVVCGLSVGGQIALGLAQRRPDLVRTLILSDTAHKIGTAETWNARITAVESGGMESIGDAVMERWFSPEYRRDQPAALKVWRNMLVRTPADGYTGTCAALRESDLTAVARGIAVPTLCLCGALDLATPPELVRSMAEIIPGARFNLIPGAGHLPGIEFPDPVADLIADFARESAFA